MRDSMRLRALPAGDSRLDHTIARQTESLRLGTHQLKSARSAAQAALKAPYFAKRFAILTAPRPATLPVLRCNLERSDEAPENKKMNAGPRFSGGPDPAWRQPPNCDCWHSRGMDNPLLRVLPSGNACARRLRSNTGRPAT